MTDLEPGDILVVATGKNWFARLIRVGQALRGQPCTGNHVAVMHHTTDGVPWGIEGRPGGVGWVDLRRFLADKQTVTNEIQPKTEAQRLIVTQRCEAMLGTKYDWMAIKDDAVMSLGLTPLWTQDWDEKGVPGQVVCSSFAAWAYGEAELPHPRPGNEQHVFPSDWAEFIYQATWAQEANDG